MQPYMSNAANAEELFQGTPAPHQATACVAAAACARTCAPPSGSWPTSGTPESRARPERGFESESRDARPEFSSRGGSFLFHDFLAEPRGSHRPEQAQRGEARRPSYLEIQCSDT